MELEINTQYKSSNAIEEITATNNIIDEELLDPITLEIMKDPVITTPCMHTFDRNSLLIWLENNNTCPICKIRIGNKLTRNYALYNIIQKLHGNTTTECIDLIDQSDEPVSQFQQNPREDLIDPITRQIMYDPVITGNCWHRFDRSSIEKWLEKSDRCPMCDNKIIKINIDFKTRQKISETYPDFELKIINESDYEVIFYKIITNEYNNATHHDITILRNLPIHIKNSWSNLLELYIRKTTYHNIEIIKALITPFVLHTHQNILNLYCINNHDLDINIIKLLFTIKLFLI